MKPSYTQTFDSIAALEDRRSLFSTLYIRLGLYSGGKTFHTPSEEKEDYSACMPRKADSSLSISQTKHFVSFLK